MTIRTAFAAALLAAAVFAAEPAVAQDGPQLPPPLPAPDFGGGGSDPAPPPADPGPADAPGFDGPLPPVPEPAPPEPDSPDSDDLGPWLPVPTAATDGERPAAPPSVPEPSAPRRPGPQYDPPQYDPPRYDPPRYDPPRYDPPRYDPPWDEDVVPAESFGEFPAVGSPVGPAVGASRAGDAVPPASFESRVVPADAVVPAAPPRRELIDATVDGVWDTTYTSITGHLVRGPVRLGGVGGTILGGEGRIDGLTRERRADGSTVLRGRWVMNGFHGRLAWTVTPGSPARFTGSWRLDGGPPGDWLRAGGWTGTLVSAGDAAARGVRPAGATAPAATSVRPAFGAAPSGIVPSATVRPGFPVPPFADPPEFDRPPASQPPSADRPRFPRGRFGSRRRGRR